MSVHWVPKAGNGWRRVIRPGLRHSKASFWSPVSESKDCCFMIRLPLEFRQSYVTAWVVGTVFYAWMLWRFIEKGYVQVCFMLCSLRPYICESWIIKFVSPLEAVPECSFQSVVLRTLQLVPSVGLKQQTDFKQGLHSCRSKVSRMGHQTSKIPFVLLMHHFLKQYGVNLPEEQLTNCY